MDMKPHHAVNFYDGEGEELLQTAAVLYRFIIISYPFQFVNGFPAIYSVSIVNFSEKNLQFSVQTMKDVL